MKSDLEVTIVLNACTPGAFPVLVRIFQLSTWGFLEASSGIS